MLRQLWHLGMPGVLCSRFLSKTCDIPPVLHGFRAGPSVLSTQVEHVAVPNTFQGLLVPALFFPSSPAVAPRLLAYMPVEHMWLLWVQAFEAKARLEALLRPVVQKQLGEILNEKHNTSPQSGPKVKLSAQLLGPLPLYVPCAQWEALRSPSISWGVILMGCVFAWGLGHGMPRTQLSCTS